MLEQLPDYLLVLITLVYSIFTWKMLKANKEMVDESKRNREMEYKPDVIIYFDESERPSVLNLVVRNIGRGLAEDIAIKNLTPITGLDDLSSANFLNTPIKSLAPGQKLVALVGIMAQLKDENGNLPKIEFEVRYRNKYGKTYIDNYSIDSNMYKGAKRVLIKTTHDIAKEMKKINENLDKINGELVKANNRYEDNDYSD